MRKAIGAVLFVLVVSLSLPAQPTGEARLLRFPTIHGDRVVFTYAGDLYTVSAQGGIARRLTSHDGFEMFARFSPDGKRLAFTGQYDGNTEVYVMPADGGVPQTARPTPPRSAATTSPIAWGPTTSSWAGRTTTRSSSARA